MRPDDGVGAKVGSGCRVTTETCSGTAVFHLEGDVVAGTIVQIRPALAGAVGEPKVMLDLTGVNFIDSVGLGTLLSVISGVHKQGGLVAIADADPRRGVARGLRVAGVDRLVFLADSSAGALVWLSDPTSIPEAAPG